MSERWWRAKNNAVNNRKLQKLSGDLFKAWFNVNCLASENGGVVPSLEDVAFALRITEQRAAAILTQLATSKLLDKVDGKFVPHDWDDHQFKTDKKDPTAKDRMQRYRDRKRNGETDVTESYDRNERNAIVSDKRPEAEANTESEQSRADACAPMDEDLKRRAAALGAGISAHFLGRNLPVPRNLDRCGHWLGQGYQQGKILTAVELVLKRGAKPAVLEYFDGAIADAHAGAPTAEPSLKPVVQNVFVEVGTLEWGCWEREHQRLGRRPPMQRDTRIDNVVKTGWWFQTRFPEGYDECTGERIAPADWEVAA